MDTSSVVGLLLSFIMIYVSITLDTPIEIFINVPSLIIVVGGTFALLLISFPLTHVFALLKPIKHVLFLPKVLENKYDLEIKPIEKEVIICERELKFGIAIFKRIPPLAISVGCVSFMIDIGKIFYSLSDVIRIGPSILLASLSLFYSLIFSFFICLPIRYKLEHHLEELSWLKSGKLAE